jgi:DNA-binding NarL/FixJ family response regulator
MGTGTWMFVQLICTRHVRIQGQKWSLSIRILIADDFKDWRRQVHSLLQARPTWQVIAESSDGSEAVQKAEDLKPDLIVLDIGLPNLNGIEAARRIRRLSPNSKIVFLSQNNDLDVVRAALGTGAQGYVYKMDVRRDFWPAIEAVLRGQQFVSSSLKGYELTDTARENLPRRHEVQFYSDDAVFLDTFAHFIAVALKAGDAAIAVITESHRDGLVLRLKAQGLDVDAAIQEGRYIQLDVAETLSTFMVYDMPDADRFVEVVGGLIEAAAKAAKREHRRVVACGECSPLLWAQGKPDAAIRVEQLWDEVGKTFGVDILCGYAFSSFHNEEDEHVFQSICAEHSAVYSR